MSFRDNKVATKGSKIGFSYDKKGLTLKVYVSFYSIDLVATKESPPKVHVQGISDDVVAIYISGD